MQQVCDVAMPRVKIRMSNSVFWWSEELARLRRTSVVCSRQFTRACKRGEPAQDLNRKYELRKQARRVYKMAIRHAKAQAWEMLMDTINGDPWGRPYRIVLG